MTRFISIIILVFPVIAVSYFQGISSKNSTNKDVYAASIETATLHVKWEANKPNPVVWNVLAGKTRWHSILAINEEGDVISQHLSINGVLNGKNITVLPDSLSVIDFNRPAKNKLIYSYSIPETGLELKQIFEESDYPYYFNMSISLSNNSIKKYTVLPDDSLDLILGPGLGQKKTGQQEYKRSMYYYIEPVASNNGEVLRYIADSLNTSIFPWETSALQWIGLQDRYFALLVLSNQVKDSIGKTPFLQSHVSYSSYSLDGEPPVHELPVLYLQIPVLSLEPGEKIQWDFTIFSGPKSYAALVSGHVNLRSLLFSDLWSWMRWLCLGLYRLLSFIHFFIPNWGWSIIILALVIRIVLYPIAQKAQKSQNQFVKAQKQMLPELNEIKTNYKGGERSELILHLYKKYNVSPFAGLKPLLVVLIQLPILIALFHVLGTAYELRDTSFLWIDTLSEPDHLFSFVITIPILGEYFNLLPFLMAVVTLLTFKLSPAPTTERNDQKLQNVFLLGMTFMFFFLFYNFPSGMVLYWTFANIFHIAQQRLMMRNPV